MTSALLAGLVAAAVTAGGATFAQPDGPPPADHPVPAATPQVSPDHPAMTTLWRPR